MATRPKGRTYQERWPHDAATDDWLAAPWLPAAGGGLAGLFGLPLGLAALFSGLPLVLLGVVAVVAAATWVGRRPDLAGSVARRAWSFLVAGLLMAAGGWLLSFAAVGVLHLLCGDTTCGNDPATGFGGDTRVVVVQAGVLLGGMAIGMGAAYAAVRLRARLVVPPRVPDPEGDTWRERRRAHGGDGF